MKTTEIQGHSIHLAEPSDLPKTGGFVGRDDEMRLCRIAWGLDENYRFQDQLGMKHLAFRLHGNPGMGKNEIVYELVRRIRANNPTFAGIPFYSMVGHDEMSPEDMILAVVPAESTTHSNVRMVLRASPLATAILTGGIFFFDEMNRLPERALAPLAPVLDDRGTLFSSSSGVWIGPTKEALPFRFCCALNPDAGHDLPDYIEQRTLPKVEITYPGHDGLIRFLRSHLTAEEGSPGDASSEDLELQLTALRKELDATDETPSVRQALLVIRLARALARENGKDDFTKQLQVAFDHVLPRLR